MNEKTFEELLQEEEINELKKGKVLEGTVFEKDNDGIWVALEGATGDVFVRSEELLKNISEYNTNDKITVKVVKTNDAEGFNTASEKRAKAEKILDDIEEDNIVNARFNQRLKKGYGMLINGAVRAFLPGSLSLLRPEDPMPEGDIKVKVISKRGRKLVVSRRDVKEQAIKEIYDEYKEKMVVEGIVESVKDFGAFVKLNEHVTALIPRSEINWDKVNNIHEILSEGDKVRGVIINLDKDSKKISISLKQMKDDPWKNVEDKFPKGTIHQGTVTKIFPFGFTVKLDDGIEGLVHESEVFWARKGKISDVVALNDVVEVKVLDIDKENRRMNLSYREAIGNPWEDIDEKYNEGNVVKGTVEKILPNGAIIKLEEGLTGFLHVSELSWNFIDSVEEALKEGDKEKVKILNIDKENKKIKLSIKQAKENPWKKVSKEVKVGDTLKGKITRFAGKGAVVLIDDYDVEGFLPGARATEEKVEDIEEKLNIGDEVEGKVLNIEFENDEKRGNLIISVYDLIKEQEKEESIKAMEEMNEDIED
jgi:small subunit ribosomal protein S1